MRIIKNNQRYLIVDYLIPFQLLKDELKNLTGEDDDYFTGDKSFDILRARVKTDNRIIEV